MLLQHTHIQRTKKKKKKERERERTIKVMNFSCGTLLKNIYLRGICAWFQTQKQ